MESNIENIVSGSENLSNIAYKQIKFAKNKAKIVWSIKSNISNVFFLWIKNKNDFKIYWNTL